MNRAWTGWWLSVVMVVGVVGVSGLVGPATERAAMAADTATETLQLPEDLTATLFAAEPLLSSPSDIDVDAQGRVWVCEVMNYRGKKETRPEGDRILVLEDTDGDGKADTQTVFHQGRDVDSALGICVIGEGPGRKVVVSCAPDVFVFHDDDGDLKADRRESLFTKTGEPQHDHSVHAFSVGPDGRWYFNVGNTGKAVHDSAGQPVVDRFGNVVNDSGKPYRQGMVFRCRPDGSDFEVLGHNFRNNYEVAVDSFGTLWQSDNDDDGNQAVRINWVMEYGNYGYVDERTGDGWMVPRTNLEAETPPRHWHQNDPGVVPNLLVTGGGSPTGICVYEGSLLPERFRGSLFHCDAGPNVVRAYHVETAGAGYTGRSEAIIDGSADRWFRPSDVCVAPDGALIVADWHDPGVGGHGMGDTEKGRIYRIAPREEQGPIAATRLKGSIPAVDFKTVAGCVTALASPNLCARATALEHLGMQPQEAAPALAKAFDSAVDPRLKARLAWAAGMLPGQSERWIKRLSNAQDEQQRIIAVRICRLTQGDILGLVEQLAADQSAAVRRECAIALRGVGGERADRAWAELAAAHKAGDRWALEALGIGADGGRGLAGPSHWDGRMAAWLARIDNQWKTPAAREIVWRSRATGSAAMICELIADPAISTVESLALVRALDFQNPASVNAVLPRLVAELKGPDEKLQVIRPELVRRPEATAATTTIATRIVTAAGGAVVPPPQAKGGKPLPPVSELLARTGNPVNGKVLFAGAGTCGKCHIVNGEGKAVGPNLSGIGAKLSREALYESILAPSAAISHSYETFTALLKDGRSFTGLLISQSPEKIVIRGADSIDVTLPAGEVEELVKQPVSLMPADLVTALSADELVDLVAWLETLRVTQ